MKKTAIELSANEQMTFGSGLWPYGGIVDVGEDVDGPTVGTVVPDFPAVREPPAEHEAVRSEAAMRPAIAILHGTGRLLTATY
jgi:hypothetical protein